MSHKHRPLQGISNRFLLWAVWTLLVGGLLVGIPVLSKGKADISDGAVPNTVMTVNGEAVAERELQMLVRDSVSEVLGYFNQKYGVSETSDFWKKDYGLEKENPHELLIRKAVDRMTSMKLEQELMKEKGVVQDTGYSTFDRLLRQENQRRKDAVAKGAAIYGPQQYEPLNYYLYLHSIRWLEVMKKVQTPEDDLRRYYSDNREQYKLPDTLVIREFTFPAGPGGRGDSKERAEKLRALLIDRHQNPVQELQYSDVTVKEHRFTGQSRRRDSEDFPILGYSERMAKGDVSEVLKLPYGVSVLLSLDRISGEYQGLEDVRRSVLDQVVTQKLTSEMEERRKKAVVHVRTDAVKQIVFR